MARKRKRNRDTDDADRAFHVGIAEATHNSALVSVVTDLWDKGRGAIWKRMEAHFQTPTLRAAVLRDHEAILRALQAKDARAARRAMREHLERVDLELNRGWDELKERETPKAPTAARARGR